MTQEEALEQIAKEPTLIGHLAAKSLKNEKAKNEFLQFMRNQNKEVDLSRFGCEVIKSLTL